MGLFVNINNACGGFGRVFTRPPDVCCIARTLRIKLLNFFAGFAFV
jgi:hypothetical protein